MSSDLPDRLLGLGIDESDERRPDDGGEDEQEEYERFVFVELGARRLALDVDDVRTITDPPEEVTRVPRSPRTVEGVTDLRGEITAVVDLRLHFPTREDLPADHRLVVFETGPEEQPAAIRVDDVLGVESVPERNVIEEGDLAAGSLEDVPFGVEDVDADVFEHPLIVAAVVKEAGVQIGIDDLLPTAADAAAAGEDASADPLGARLNLDRGDGEEFGEVFDEPEAATSEESTRESERLDEDREVETTGLLDVDRLLLASGRR